jgi:hypothetical protein
MDDHDLLAAPSSLEAGGWRHARQSINHQQQQQQQQQQGYLLTDGRWSDRSIGVVVFIFL